MAESKKRVAEESLALGRIKFAQVLASAVQMKNPCMPNAETSVPEVKIESAKKAPRPKRKGKK